MNFSWNTHELESVISSFQTEQKFHWHQTAQVSKKAVVSSSHGKPHYNFDHNGLTFFCRDDLIVRSEFETISAEFYQGLWHANLGQIILVEAPLLQGLATRIKEELVRIWMTEPKKIGSVVSCIYRRGGTNGPETQWLQQEIFPHIKEPTVSARCPWN